MTKNEILVLLKEFNQLKKLFREGWLRYIDRKDCESVAEHCFMTALLSMFIKDKYFPKANIEKILRMALIHEAGEIYVGDITPHDNISKEEKHKKEKEAVELIFSNLSNGKNYISLWEEYELGKTLEAQIVGWSDRLELAYQALIYEKNHEIDLQEFFDSVEGKITDEKVNKIFDEIKELRK